MGPIWVPNYQKEGGVLRLQLADESRVSEEATLDEWLDCVALQTMTRSDVEHHRAGIALRTKEASDALLANAKRLMAKHGEPEMYHREQILFSRDQYAELEAELWELSRTLLDARRRDVWYRNTSQCYQYNRPCQYFPICRSGGNPNVIDNHYQRVTAHEELREEPVF
jgi:hypothetical protein